MTVEAAFTHFPTLTTPRLCLRQVQESDAQALYAIKSDPEVTQAYGQEPHASLEQTLGWIHRLQADYPARASLFWAITLRGSDQVIGECVFWNFDAGFHCAELGYELNRACWRQGLMAEAVSAVLAFGFDGLSLHRIEACPYAQNDPSVNFLVKLGFTCEGSLRQRHFFRGQYLDQNYYGLLEEEWRKFA